MTTSISGRPFMTPVFRQPGAPWPRTTARPEPSGMERRHTATSGADDWGYRYGPQPVPALLNPFEWPAMYMRSAAVNATYSMMFLRMIWGMQI